MSRLVWHLTSGLHDAGVDRGVLYLGAAAGVPWNGLVSVNEKANSAVSSMMYFDGYRRVLQEVSEFGATVEAYTYPDEFAAFTGDEVFFSDNQPRGRFNFSYRTMREPGYLIHLVYNAIAGPAPRTMVTFGEAPDTSTFVWDIEASAAIVNNAKPSAHLVVDTQDSPATAVTALEDLLYGTDAASPTMPSPEMVMSLFEVNATMTIVDNSDGTWTATGPDSMIQMLDADTFRIAQPDAVYIHEDVYTIATH